uniref:Transmembrane protein n=1 Tax=Anopheles maculatus TaxID=74869 RepID=A0A182T247_9DIPT
MAATTPTNQPWNQQHQAIQFSQLGLPKIHHPTHIPAPLEDLPFSTSFFTHQSHLAPFLLARVVVMVLLCVILSVHAHFKRIRNGESAFPIPTERDRTSTSLLFAVTTTTTNICQKRQVLAVGTRWY